MSAEARVDGEALLREVEHLERIEDQDGLMRFDERIHRYTWEAAGNPFLTGTLERYFTLSLRVWYLVLDRVPGLGHTVHDQVQLIEALLDRNGPRARTIMREHVLAFQRDIMAAFTQA
jgi:DNA-binding GntR family transcriptional regulator